MKFNLSISRNSKDLVGIRVKCDESRVNFLELELTLCTADCSVYLPYC